MSDWRENKPRKFTDRDRARISAQVKKQVAKEKEAKAKADERAVEEAERKKLEENQMSFF